jgi:competence protein ComEC
VARAGPDENAVPPDLRLIPGACALWAGTLLGVLAGPQIAWWTAALAGVAVLAVSIIRPAGWPGWLAALAFLIVAVTITGLRQAERAADPVTLAAEQRSWVHVNGEVAGFPKLVTGGFTAPDATGDADRRRWRVDVDVHTVDAAAIRSTSTSTVAVLGTGSSWAELLPGRTIHAAGRLGVSTFAGLPSISLTARDPPDVRDDASPAYASAGAIRSALHEAASGLDGDAAGLLPGLVVGDTGGIDDRLDADAKATGITHQLA